MRGWAVVLVSSLLLAGCSGPRRPGVPDLGVGDPPVTPDAVESARPPDPNRLVTRRGGDIMLYPDAEGAAIKRQREALKREFDSQPKLDGGLPR